MSKNIEAAKARIAFWKAKFEELEAKKERNGGRLKRQEWWEREYCQSLYLTFSSDEYLERRFIDHFHNNVCLTAEGQIAPREDFSEGSGLIGPLFSHMQSEILLRGGLRGDVIRTANQELDKYFANGTPTGVALFRNFPETLKNVIVKFGKKSHLRSALTNGEIRLTPANFYQKGSLLNAMRDFETERWFHDPKFDLVLNGEKSFKIRDRTVDIEDGFFKFSVSCPNYLLWSACRDIDRRLPDDFGADAALIIREPQKFAARLSHRLKSIWPNVPVWHGNIKYYDPCSFADIKTRPETIKHFSYLYQREWRFCAFPYDKYRSDEAFSISLGSLSDIAELVTI